MARLQRTTIEVHIRVDEYETGLGLGDDPNHKVHRFDYSQEWTSGTTDGTQADRVYSLDADVGTSPTSLDLLGSLTSRLNSGNAVNFVDLCLVAVKNDAALASGNLEVGGGSNAVVGIVKASGDIIPVGPQGCLVWVAPGGIAPVAATGDILQLAASAGTLAGEGLLVGRSA